MHLFNSTFNYLYTDPLNKFRKSHDDFELITNLIRAIKRDPRYRNLDNISIKKIFNIFYSLINFAFIK